MLVLTLRITLHAPWVHSLKEKRMVVKSLVAKLRNKFNASVSEIDQQDIHQTAVIGIAAIAASQAQADSIADAVLRFVEENTEAEITAIEKDL